MIATWVIQVYLILLKPKGTIESNPSFNRCINQGEVRDTLLHPRFGIEGTLILYKNLYK